MATSFERVTTTPSATAVAALIAVTKEAQRALGSRSEVRIAQFPFKVGRESRSLESMKRRAAELKIQNVPELNDVYLLEPPWSDLLQISREHFLIDKTEDGFVLVDRGSFCGTIVAGTAVGGGRVGGRTPVKSGDQIVVGTPGSDYIFRFETL